MSNTLQSADGIPGAQLAKDPTPAQRAAFLRAYARCKSQSAQDRLHENQFKDAQ